MFVLVESSCPGRESIVLGEWEGVVVLGKSGVVLGEREVVLGENELS